ncbi:hypothetical protein [Arthrobacter sp. D2-10]
MSSAAAAAGCTMALKPRASAFEIAAALIMVVAMVDGMIGPNLLPSIVWALILLFSALAAAAVHRSTVGCDSLDVPHNAMTSHRSIGAILMAGLLLVSGSHHDGLPPSAHAEHSGGVLELLPVVAAGGFAAASLWFALGRRATYRSQRFEAALMGFSVLLMAPSALA